MNNSLKNSLMADILCFSECFFSISIKERYCIYQTLKVFNILLTYIKKKILEKCVYYGMLVNAKKNGLSGQVGQALICRVGQFLWCKYSYYCRFYQSDATRCEVGEEMHSSTPLIFLLYRHNKCKQPQECRQQ